MIYESLFVSIPLVNRKSVNLKLVMADIVTNHKSPARLSHPRNLRGGHRVARHGGQVAARRKARSPNAFARWKMTRSGFTTRTLTNTRTATCKSPAQGPAQTAPAPVEIRKLFELASVKGNTLVPLSFFWKNGKVKVALASARATAVRPAPGFEGARVRPRSQRATMKWSRENEINQQVVLIALCLPPAPWFGW